MMSRFIGFVFVALTFILAPSTYAETASGRHRTKAVPVNLALSKPAIASSSQDGHGPRQANDGDVSTRWCAQDGKDGYWWQVDLQKSETLSGCQIQWEKDNASYQYRIEGSRDGIAWRTLAEENNNLARPQIDTLRFNATDIRYVRVTVTHAPDGAWASFWEMQVWGTTMVEVADEEIDPRIPDVRVPTGFEATYFAGPPDVSYPTCISAQPTGEVFVGVDQNGSLDQQAHRGWVVRCRDTNGDGVADVFNRFAEMDSPRGIVFDKNVLYVMHPPVLEAFYDDHGTGTANRSEVLVRGLAHGLDFRGADHTCNGVRMGIDGWLYIALGDYGALHAVGKDGSAIQLHGGGIVRVRPDGTQLEIVCSGTRNIYDVAINSLMDLFTCDNTNDGDDWNVRLSHMIATAHYGYPSRFRNYPDEIMPTMADYGGGAPTGSVFLDEPGWIGGLYCCQWGWDNVTQHPLTRAGATFTAEKSQFIHIPRPTGIDIDGLGNLYVASWAGATFSYAGPHAGYILRVHPSNYFSPKFPNIGQLSDVDLVKVLTSPSATWRLHTQQEILWRGDKPVFRRELTQQAESSANATAIRVAALYTLEQLAGAGAEKTLTSFTKEPNLRPYALRALTDQKTNTAKLPTSHLIKYLTDTNPRVRLEAVIVLNRLKRAEAIPKILPLLADADIAVAHVAFRALVDMNAEQACFGAIYDQRTNLIPGAFRVLRNLHTAANVNGLQLLATMEQTQPITRSAIDALCRLYFREADYDGSWWGTRPDTRGPYYQPITWQQSPAIAALLQHFAVAGDRAVASAVLQGMAKYQIEFTNLTPVLIRIGTQYPELRKDLISIVSREKPLPKYTLTFLTKMGMDTNAEASLRWAAFRSLEDGLQKETNGQSGAAIISVLLYGEPSPLIAEFRSEFRSHTLPLSMIQSLTGILTFGNPDQREFAFEICFDLLANPKASKSDVAMIRLWLDGKWDASNALLLLRATQATHSTNYLGEVARWENDTNAIIANLAHAIMYESYSHSPAVATVLPERQIGHMEYADVAREAAAMVGNPSRGKALFDTLGCIKCHTVTKDQPLKGPFLGDITKRYNSTQIIESILKPNVQIAQGFITTTVTTKDDTDYDGFIVRESGDELELRNLSGATVIKKKDIVRRGTRKTSIMPEGLLDKSSPDDLAALLSFLQQSATAN